MTGCWNRRELNSLAILSGLAIDKAEDPSKIQITAQILKPGEIKAPSGGGGGGGAKAYLNLTSTGDTFFEAIRGFTHEINRKVYLPHNQIIIFSQEAAKEGVRKHLDFIIRDHEPRLMVWILVSKGKAGEVLETKAELEKVPAIRISQLIEAQGATSETTVVKLHEFLPRLMSKTTAPVASLVEVSGEGQEKTARLEGTAVFKQDKLAGFLNKEETRGLLWVLGQVKSGIIAVESPGGNGKASLEIIRASSKITPEIKDNELYITVEINEEGNLGDQMGTEDLTTPAAWTSLEKRQAAAIRKEIMAAIKKAQELNTDIFGFGDAVHRKYPKVWKDIEKQWDEFFPDLEVKLIINAKLRRTGITTKAAKPE